MGKHLPIYFLILMTSPLGLYSIRFDQYYNYNGVPIDNGPCFQIVSRCHSSEQCCGIASCVLPSWTSKPVCLMPGYKQYFQYIFKSNNLTITEKSLNTLNTHFPDIKSLQDESLDGSLEPSNQSLDDNFFNASIPNKFELTSINSVNILVQDVLDLKDNYYNKNNSLLFNNNTEEFKLILRNHHKFLLLNSSLEESSLQSNLSEIFETFKSTDVTKVLVKFLQERLKMLNENDKVRRQNIEIETTSRTPSRATSKWDIIRAFVLNKRNGEYTVDTVNENLKDEVKINDENYAKPRDFNELKATEDNIYSFGKLEDEKGQLYDETKLGDEPLGNFPKENVKPGFGETEDGDKLEYYTVQLPYNIEHVDTNGAINVQVKSEIDENTSTSNYNQSVNLSCKENKSNSEIIKSETWKKILFWPLKRNKSNKNLPIVRNISSFKNESSKKHSRLVKLNEQFLLTLNSKNISKSEYFDSSQTEDTKRITDNYYSLSDTLSAETASSESEDLYNNSIVFVVHKRNQTGSVRVGRWRSVLNFFHIAKAIPCPESKNPCIMSTNGICTFDGKDFEETDSVQTTETTSTQSEEPTTAKTIYLPQNLWPEALQGREFKSSDAESMEDYDLKLENPNTTSGGFLFFFK